MEVLTRKLEEHRANTNACDLSKIICGKVLSNPQSQSDSPSFPSRIKSAAWINHLNLVRQITSMSKPACDNNITHYHHPVQDHNQPQPIPMRITHRKSSSNLKNRVHQKKFKNKQASMK